MPFGSLHRAVFLILLIVSNVMAASIDGSPARAGFRSPPQNDPDPAAVVISQIYGAGGDSGATLKNDFVELFNRSPSTVSLLGWSVQYADATATRWRNDRITVLPNADLEPGHYLLIQEGQGPGGISDLPPPDATGTINLSPSAGKLALVRSTVPLTCTLNCAGAPAVADFVGYGDANDFAGSPAPSPLLSTSALFRNEAGCTATGDNGADWTSDTTDPRNTGSSPHNCPVPTLTPTISTPTPFPTNTATASVAVSITLNEIMPDPDATDATPYVELYNAGAEAASTDGWQIAWKSDSAVLTTTINTGAFFVLHLPRNSLAFSDTIQLIKADDTIVDSFSWANTTAGQVWSRLPDGSGDWTDLLPPSPGRSNGLALTPTTEPTTDTTSSATTLTPTPVETVANETITATTVEPTTSEIPTASRTVRPTATERPTRTSRPTATEHPTPTSRPTDTERPTPTSRPTDTERPTPTDQPTIDNAPSANPTNTRESQITEGATPTDVVATATSLETAASPTHTSKPTRTLRPTRTSLPTAIPTPTSPGTATGTATDDATPTPTEGAPPDDATPTATDAALPDKATPSPRPSRTASPTHTTKPTRTPTSTHTLRPTASPTATDDLDMNGRSATPSSTTTSPTAPLETTVAPTHTTDATRTPRATRTARPTTTATNLPPDSVVLAGPTPTDEPADDTATAAPTHTKRPTRTPQAAGRENSATPTATNPEIGDSSNDPTASPTEAAEPARTSTPPRSRRGSRTTAPPSPAAVTEGRPPAGEGGAPSAAHPGRSSSPTPFAPPAAEPATAGRPGSVLFVEVMYYGRSPNGSNEWIVLRNIDRVAIDLIGWKLVDAKAMTALPTLTLAPSGAVVIAAQGPSVDMPDGVPVVALHHRIGNGLSNRGDHLRLIDGTGTMIDGLSWGVDHSILEPPAPAVTAGHWLVRVANAGTGADWIEGGPEDQPSTPSSTTPPARRATGAAAPPRGQGATGTGATTAATQLPTHLAAANSRVILSEIAPGLPMIELYNADRAPVDLTGWMISINETTRLLPAGETIDGYGFWVLSGPDLHLPPRDATIKLLQPDGSVVDTFHYTVIPDGRSASRYPVHGGAWEIGTPLTPGDWNQPAPPTAAPPVPSHTPTPTVVAQAIASQIPLAPATNWLPFMVFAAFAAIVLWVARGRGTPRS